MPTTPSPGGSVRAARRQIALYFGVGYLFFYLCTPATGFANIAIQWLLKNRLSLSPQQMALFQLVIAAPTYVAFVFGLARDKWSFFGRGDQGILWLFAPLGALGYFWAASATPTGPRILIATLLVMVAFRFISASLHALTASVGQRYGMTGPLSTLWNIVATTLF